MIEVHPEGYNGIVSDMLNGRNAQSKLGKYIGIYTYFNIKWG